ncbi:efflux RND transporter periplasmic adaptor subunit [Thiobacillus sp.]|uniref:efflux RND transporter periplasmic adaptor subunit n=1 Tax=Thiobacillus sp. TaxID=924 RepID=UPI0017EC7D96|nr:efflux RND transporter periplasmic adaptor subunit [Thiobacillus sp.]MBC2729310.1 efflux RND transporter periplasmic adaptor subunit [Thiobacillus sp.]MBC2738045.1 efflux RND transporter periplasmic adaptor subunit [Thiobacillus sp.]MBC2759637.1 efflux RND transporter periplasmic adaptor subunit [Thiobacillus sp.]
MSRQTIKKTALVLFAVIALLAVGAAAGLWWERNHVPADGKTMPATAAKDGRSVLYWYDPMVPTQKFDKPGKSPFMDMQLVPKYADEGGDASTVTIDPGVAQNLGVRLATVTRAPLDLNVVATGIVNFNERDIAVVQARTGGFVERVARLAPNDVVGSGAFIAELLVPEWAALQQEYLALKAVGDAPLEAAARERMRLGGMPESLIRAVVQTGKVRNRISITTPRAGVIQTLDVRPGMTLMAGQTMARVNGISTVWLDVSVPEAQAGAVLIGQSAEAKFAAFPGKPVQGRVTALLPTLNDAARALRVRVELPNKDGRLRPGLTAQVSLKGAVGESALLVPTEAVIRTGRRALVIVAEAEGRYRPVDVVLGPESGADTVIASGLDEGQKIVASGQFLIDSEASLQGIVASPSGPDEALPAAVALHEADAVIKGLSGTSVTLAHGPFKTLSMPGMTMEFPLANPELGQGLKVGDRVRVGVRETDDGLLVEKLDKTGGEK